MHFKFGAFLDYLGLGQFLILRKYLPWKILLPTLQYQMRLAHNADDVMQYC